MTNDQAETEAGPAEPSAVEPAAEYAVGYRRPPLARRFRPGRSGNPRGRPKGGRKLAAIVAEAMSERVVVKENGRLRRITKIELAVKQLVNRAAGETRVTQLLLALVQAHEAKPAPTGGEFPARRTMRSSPD